MLTIRLFKNLKRGIKWSSSKSSFIQVLHQQIRGGGFKPLLILLMQGGMHIGPKLSSRVPQLDKSMKIDKSMSKLTTIILIVGHLTKRQHIVNI